MEIAQLLENMGLTDKEPQVYLELLKTPGVQPASVIAQKTKLNRSTVYKTLIRLAEVGLVTKTMKFGITCFFAEEPDRALENFFNKRKSQLDNLNKELIAALPEIKNMQQHELATPKMRYYEGVEGLKRVYEDTLVEEDTIYSFENVEAMAQEVSDYLFQSYLPRRIEKEIFAHVITPKNKGNEVFRKADKKSLRQTKFVPTAAFPLEVEINVYGNKTAFFSYKKEEMFGAILESEAIASSMKAIFSFCWKFAT